MDWGELGTCSLNTAHPKDVIEGFGSPTTNNNKKEYKDRHNTVWGAVQAGRFIKREVHSQDVRAGELKEELHPLGLQFLFFTDSC